MVEHAALLRSWLSNSTLREMLASGTKITERLQPNEPSPVLLWMYVEALGGNSARDYSIAIANLAGPLGLEIEAQRYARAGRSAERPGRVEAGLEQCPAHL